MNNQPRPAGAYKMTNGSWKTYQAFPMPQIYYTNLIREILDQIYGEVGDQALPDNLISAINYLELELVRMEEMKNGN